MTPQQKIYWLVFNKLSQYLGLPPPPYPYPNIEEAIEKYLGTDVLQVAISVVRHQGVQTDLTSPSSRNYETSELAAKLPDGSWVGWTYYYGGGKHGCPEDVPWMEYSYDVQCDAYEKVKTVLYFKRKD